MQHAICEVTANQSSRISVVRYLPPKYGKNKNTQEKYKYLKVVR